MRLLKRFLIVLSAVVATSSLAGEPGGTETLYHPADRPGHAVPVVDEYPVPPPRTFGGKPIDPLTLGGYGPIPRGFFATMGGFFGVGLSRAGTEWAALLEDGSGVPNTTSFNRFKELVGDRDIKFRPGVSESEIGRQVFMHDENAYQAEYESHPVAAFAGGSVPFIVAPGTLLTILVVILMYVIPKLYQSKDRPRFAKIATVAMVGAAITQFVLEILIAGATRTDASEWMVQSVGGAVLGTLLLCIVIREAPNNEAGSISQDAKRVRDSCVRWVAYFKELSFPKRLGIAATGFWALTVCMYVMVFEPYGYLSDDDLWQIMKIVVFPPAVCIAAALVYHYLVRSRDDG